MIIALININGPLFRKIKLLTLVQDSSMEQKRELFPSAKLQTIIGIAKLLSRFLRLQQIRHDKSK